jgi:GAF domain-containing protein/HAMP domain-containing protein
MSSGGSGNFMTTNLTTRSQERIAQQTRNARRVALLVMFSTMPSLVPFGFWAFQSGAWQLFVDTGFLFATGVTGFIGLQLIQRGRVTLGVQVILVGMGIGVLALNLLIAGLGILLGITIALLITAIAGLTLPESVADPITVIAFGLGLLIVLLDALLPDYRLNAPELNAYAPVAISALAGPCLYLILRQFGTYSLRGKLTLTLLLVTIFPAALQAVAFNALAGSNRKINAQETLQVAAQQAAGRVDRFMQDKLSGIGAVARLPAVIDYLAIAPDLRNLTQVAVTLESLSSQNRFIRSYAVFDLHGVTVFDTSRSNIGADQLKQPYVQTPLQTGQPYISEVLFDPLTGEGLIHFSAPVLSDRGDVLGLAQVAYSLSALQDLVAQFKDLGGNESFGILLDENHFRLADGSTPQPSFKSVIPLDPERLSALRAAKRIPDIDTAKLSTNLPEFEAGLAQAETQPFFVAEVNTTADSDQLAVVKITTRPAWLIVFGRPQRTFLDPLNDLARSSLFLVLIIGAVIVLTAARISRALAQPIINLNAVANQVAQGDLSAQAAVETEDEIGALSATFNNMTGQLRSLIGSLEGQVNIRTAQLRASAEVGRAATSILDTEELLRTIVQLIIKRFGLYYAAVFILNLDDAQQWAELRAATGEAGRVLIERRHRLEAGGQSLVGAALTTRRARIALDTGPEAVRFDDLLLPDTRSEIALPLIVGNRVLGALDVQSTQAAAFDENSAAALQTLADQIAIALSHAEQFKQTEEALKNTRNLFAASQAMNTALDVNDLLQTLIRHITPDASRAAIALLGTRDETGQPAYYEFVAAWVNPDFNTTLLTPGQDEDHRSLPPIQPGAHFTAQQLPGISAVTLARPLIVPDANANEVPPALRALLHDLGAEALMALALTAGQNPLGILIVVYHQARTFSADYLQTLVTLSGQAAIVIQNRRALADTQTALKQLDLVNRRLTGEAWRSYTASLGGALTVRDAAPGLPREATPTSKTLEISAPIMVRGKPIGVLKLQDINPDRPRGTHELTLLEAVAHEVAAAIDNARLLEQTERRAQRERLISEISRKLLAASDMQSIIQIAGDELSQALRVTRTAVNIGTLALDRSDNPPGSADDDGGLTR